MKTILPEAAVIAAVVTPCCAPGEVDPEGMTRLCGNLLNHGCDGLFVLGSTGELPLLETTERRRLTRAARAGCGDRPLFAGVTGFGLKQTIEHAHAAAEDGADAAVTQAPFFVKLNQSQLLEYGLRLADASPIPVGFYHHVRMPTRFEIDTIVRLARHPNVIALKETDRAESNRMPALTAAVGGGSFRIYAGNEPLVLAGLKAGAHGSVTALANVVPEWFGELATAWRQGEAVKPQRWQEKISALSTIFKHAAVQNSFGHFLQTVKLPLFRRGWIASPANMVPGFQSDPAFDRDILEHWETQTQAVTSMLT